MQYDLTIHIDEDGAPILMAHTPKGAEFVKSIMPDIADDDQIELTCDPADFIANMDPSFKVGMTNPETKIVTLLSKNPLH